jgi:hypothetical protein
MVLPAIIVGLGAAVSTIFGAVSTVSGIVANFLFRIGETENQVLLWLFLMADALIVQNVFQEAFGIPISVSNLILFPINLVFGGTWNAIHLFALMTLLMVTKFIFWFWAQKH